MVDYPVLRPQLIKRALNQEFGVSIAKINWSQSFSLFDMKVKVQDLDTNSW